jgi:hypothetical protein
MYIPFFILLALSKRIGRDEMRLLHWRNKAVHSQNANKVLIV